MPELTIDLEIHVPGLDLHHERWNYHVMFMDEVHRHHEEIRSLAHEYYESRGRGTVFVDPSQWMQIIQAQWTETGTFPCSYVRRSEDPEGLDLGVLGAGFHQMLEEYDPAQQVVLTVLHHPGKLLSTYLITSA